MGISCITRNTYPIPLLLLLLILIIVPSSSSFAPTDIVTKVLLIKLCSQSTIHSHRFCVRWLTADHRTTSTNIHGLIELTVDKTRAFGLKNLALMNDLARGSGNDKQLKNAYESCANSYGITIKHLEEAKEFLRNSSFQLAFHAASKAHDYAYLCKDQFDGPSNEPPFVLHRSEKLIEMCYIARDFARLFY
ncbi:hypothetical protein EUTSA_v10022010mg [Eutrema salsugineum]|uniref:Pectinesterase inhibitor domain-containing protein n=1 Tax=Eutrema salsugineum TaxID=72664 RepID=V4M3P9_EUTSA|nr:pectinesterase inhibitor [Eutrema salsugineum]ESQ49487.1 hypothetical protein EUTSA_v10022010mg [Eutrema salsugineum]